MENHSKFKREIVEMLPQMDIKFDEPLSDHTSFRIGGKCLAMAFPKNAEELRSCLKVSGILDLNVRILGAGTNVLAPDEGVSDMVICLKDCLNGMEQISETKIRVMAGITMSRAAVFAANRSLSGMEFAHGIPGTVGGGVYMNAGAYGGEIRDICREVEVMDMAGEIHIYSVDEMDFSYRHSVLEEKGGIVISAVFELNPKASEEIWEQMKILGEKRRASQPLDYPSAGSAFKRPVGGYAAALIDQTGLKGFHVGDAAVSEKHAGFVVNLGSATAQEVKGLLREVSDRVFSKTGIRLEPEIRIW